MKHHVTCVHGWAQDAVSLTSLSFLSCFGEGALERADGDGKNEEGSEDGEEDEEEKVEWICFEERVSDFLVVFA